MSGPKKRLFVDPTRYSSHVSYHVSTEVEVYRIPADDPERMNAWVRVAASTGFPAAFSDKAMRRAGRGFVSVRTSKESIPRGSFGIMVDDEIVLLIDCKTTGVGSKSKLRGMGKGKLLMLRNFWDKNRSEDKLNDPKDNNYLSRFPAREPYQKLEPESVKALNAKFKQNKFLQTDDIKEVRIYNGLIYFSMEMPQYDSKNKKPSETVKKPKHYCQEAETLASILYNLSKNLYKDASFDKQGFLHFKDDNNNHCRINLQELIMPPELAHDGEYKEKVANKFAAVKTIPELQRLVYEQDPDLKFCHAPIFTSITPEKQDSFVPVMVQAGDSGEGIIRDSDFEHFYRHMLTPALAQKSFNAAAQFRPVCNADHMDGLKLLSLRLNSASLEDFQKELNKFVNYYIDYRGKLGLDYHITLDQYTMAQLKKNHPEFETLLMKDTYNLSEEMPDKLKAILLLAKYGDVTTLAPDTPYINYMTDEFASYRDAVDESFIYYSQNKQALNNLGESSAHDMVFLFQLSHAMATHGDEGNHPKGHPEDFARITTYCNDAVIVTSSEEQYLKLLFTNPEMLEQAISIHPYWIKDLKAPNETTEAATVMGWVDLLKIQALRFVLRVNEQAPTANLAKIYDMYVQSVLINMPRRFLDESEKTLIENTRTGVAP
jgi:hypothetical protein